MPEQSGIEEWTYSLTTKGPKRTILLLIFPDGEAVVVPQDAVLFRLTLGGS